MQIIYAQKIILLMKNEIIFLSYKYNFHISQIHVPDDASLNLKFQLNV